MSLIAAVITGAPKSRMPAIRRFAADVLLSEGDYEYIRYPGAEEALAQSDALMSPERQFAIRDILHSKAQTARYRGATLCMVVGTVACDPDTDGFHECQRFVLRERDMVAKWNLFREIGVACLTPGQGIVALRT